ncbi:sulfite exporter TauE/SafE family protein [Falsibacillus pallidus]|uniref:Probable membrane transporter protein n=1 Tax=Falsibacillus pallidus TaxID=493781 RepID=A0A370GP59_9BACI|nr:sulfite exporter TauE/SafE family protein [Falsibacillus pallidus]RDI45525.1 hypothetical protein DFR59_102153 [Falsibacillus pallidus]
MEWSLLFAVLGAVFLGALTRSTFGFGEAVVSMPILALLPLKLNTSVSLIGLAGLMVALLSLKSGWKEIDKPVILKLAITTIVGIPIGIFIIKSIPSIYVTTGLGVFLVLYGVYSLGKPYLFNSVSKERFSNPNWALPFGLASGALGSAYNFNGVPVVIYATLQKWEPSKFRSMMQAHFLISGMFIVSGQAIGGLWSKELFILFGLSLPFILLATWLGRVVHQKIHPKKFERYVYILIIVLGIMLLIT